MIVKSKNKTNTQTKTRIIKSEFSKLYVCVRVCVCVLRSNKMHTNQSDGTISRKFVKLMAKKFEQISTDSYISSHEANFKQCNWWLDMPTSANCFDDLGHDPQTQSNDDDHRVDGDGGGSGDGGNNYQYGINVAPVTDAIAFETAEIANEIYQSSGSGGDQTDGLEHRPLSIDNADKIDFLQQIKQCLRFPSAKTTHHNEANKENIR